MATAPVHPIFLASTSRLQPSQTIEKLLDARGAK